MPQVSAARNPSGILVYRGISFEERSIDARGSADQVSQRLDFQPPMDVESSDSPDGQRLIYATNTFDVHQIWTANADGSEPRLLLESNVVVYVYSWSPDGRYLLYVGEPSAAAADSGPLWVMDREGRNRKPLRLPFIFGFGFDPVWSPVGHPVAAVGSTDNLSECWQNGESFQNDPLCRYKGTSVYVEDVDAGRVQMVVRNVIDPMWSPDGTLLAVSRLDEQEQVDIWLVSRDGKGLRRVTNTPTVDRHPVWLAKERTQ